MYLLHHRIKQDAGDDALSPVWHVLYCLGCWHNDIPCHSDLASNLMTLAIHCKCVLGS